MIGILAAVLFLHIGDKTIRVETNKPQQSATLSDGQRVISWDPEDAARIVAALERENLGAAIPSVLGGLRRADERERCLKIDLDGLILNLTVPGKLAKTKTGRVVWSAAQLAVIQKELESQGRIDELGRIFDLSERRVTVGEDEKDRSAALQKIAYAGPLAPKCGECLDGALCVTDRKVDCCSGKGSPCSSCKVCPAAADP